MKYNIILFLSLFFIAVPLAFSKTWTLSDSNLQVDFDDQTALIKVSDRRCDKVWEQVPFDQETLVKKVEQKGNALIVTFVKPFIFKAILSLTETSDLDVRIVANEKLPLKEFSFPSAFKSPDKNHSLLLTNSEGILLPVDDTEYPLASERIYYCGGGLVMSWLGIMDNQSKTGYMAILKTPHDADLRTFRQNGQIMFKPLWLPSLTKFGYERKVSYSFFDKGGYVAQAKKYREHIWKENKVITLKEHLKNTPTLDKIMGAVHMYVWNDAREVSIAKEMKSSGIDKAFILWDANHVPYPEIGYDTKLKELGYATGFYDIYTDLHPRDTAIYTEPYEFRFRPAYPGLLSDLALRAIDGKTLVNAHGATSCPRSILPQMTTRMDAMLKEYPHDGFFLDVWAAGGLFECYSSKHPLTRQRFAKEVNKNHKIVADRFNRYLGGEWGADYLIPNIVFAHGMMTLHRTWWGTGIERKGTIHYAGDWNNNASPSAMVGTRTANNAYLKYSINEYNRVPLYQLVYHNAIVSSWRWDDANNHAPELWWKKDLFNVLYGTVPMWSLDRNRWNEFKQTFIDSYKAICPWLQQIGYDELVSHRFITENHKIQESVFSSGKKVIVNFGDEDFEFDGKKIKAKGFLIN
jgi:hypothetical protein